MSDSPITEIVASAERRPLRVLSIPTISTRREKAVSCMRNEREETVGMRSKAAAIRNVSSILDFKKP
eukprot:scaffold119229_cov22-Prasinocladus_malaysianus.AAC.1